MRLTSGGSWTLDRGESDLVPRLGTAGMVMVALGSAPRMRCGLMERGEPLPPGFLGGGGLDAMGALDPMDALRASANTA